MTATITELASQYAEMKTIPLSAADKLIAILESADSVALRLIFKNRVKFCWMIAARILRARGEKI